jgi:hypothetical protein
MLISLQAVSAWMWPAVRQLGHAALGPHGGINVICGPVSKTGNEEREGN